MHLFLAACCMLSVSHVAAAHGADFSRSTGSAQAQNSPGAIPDSQFAIADFDGDRQPDLATVQIARFNSLHSRYWISFQLSNGGLQTIGVTAPAGGLVLVSWDVNCDRALDLVLVTPWRHELVAVLLNDGKGNFSAADPGQFEVGGISSRMQIGIAPRHLEDRAALSFQYSSLRDAGRKLSVLQKSQRALSPPVDFVTSLFASSRSSRAPPRSFLHP